MPMKDWLLKKIRVKGVKLQFWGWVVFKAYTTWRNVMWKLEHASCAAEKVVLGGFHMEEIYRHVRGVEVELIILNSHFNFLPLPPLSTVVKGGESHKSIDLTGNPILRVYYNSRVSVTKIVSLESSQHCITNPIPTFLSFCFLKTKTPLQAFSRQFCYEILS